ncbi:MtnX-like HAD-IB family phosphatase [Thermosediminibacter litoriperuensis]|uniref:HAD superfamily phosphoserine phosphatase-like hydrolase/2,3-diketo-5-methylthio-1-phosphopentane phosphatase n=1 Tax=Thermosediminibacter litoriperuensis TaxID=291989 RepID=A0A5S5AMQ1_9FIRM|nr:MtnX-like HAD-IB family phosphatase [Thermosediminibacter litoriperuensis]TYP52452.1 HAD superfamily phosphoserine phosphatase-like hydrolase/2,3-diketo-5-methylthio-1-phosphopentane phosphatase [Thermosediminibacter litoriperuensis]
MKITFFIDFDGTITKKDTCVAMTQAFARGNWEEIELRWQRGEISTEECARETFKLFDASEEDLRNFLIENMEVDDYFIPFLEFCRKRGHDIYILSDGYDFNIKTILKKYGIKDIPYFSNKLIIDGRKFDIECQHSSGWCPQCGTCKAELIDKLKPRDGISVYIGDGYSDVCAAKKADVIFAKGVLLSHCRKNDIPAIAYKDFSDIVDWARSADSPVKPRQNPL